MSAPFGIVQDGGRFYRADTGELLFSSPLVENDFDVEGAKAARRQFSRMYRETLHHEPDYVPGGVPE